MSTSLVKASAHETLDALALNYSKKRERVTSIVTDIEDAIRAIHRKHRRDLNEAIATADGALAALRAEVAANPKLFEKPKSWALHGIKFGFRKGSGKLEWDDDAVVVARIKKIYTTEEAELLIKTTEAPIADALKDLDVKTLARLGVTSEDTGEFAFAKAEETGTNKLVKRLLAEGKGREEVAT